MAGHAPNGHPHRGVLTLADAVAVLVIVLLHEHRVINADTEGLFDGDQGRPVTVTRELDAVRHPGPQVCDERLAGLGCPVTESPRRHQLGIRVNCHPRPYVSPYCLWLLGALKTVGLHIDERPCLNNRDVPAMQVPQYAVLED